MIKNIIFDLGNVLVSFQPELYLKSKGLSSDDVNLVYKEIFLSKEWVELDRGTISRDEALKAICDRNESDKKLLMENTDFEKILEPIAENVRILGELKKKGYKLYYLTNYHEDLFEYSYDKLGFFHHFDGGVVSAHVKLIKPDPPIYKKLIEKYHLQPEETLFIDDSEKNTQAATELGIQAIHLPDYNVLEELLKKSNIISLS